MGGEKAVEFVYDRLRPIKEERIKISLALKELVSSWRLVLNKRFDGAITVHYLIEKLGCIQALTPNTL
jgi:hypothetical protein